MCIAAVVMLNLEDVNSSRDIPSCIIYDDGIKRDDVVRRDIGNFWREMDGGIETTRGKVKKEKRCGMNSREVGMDGVVNPIRVTRV